MNANITVTIRNYAGRHPHVSPYRSMNAYIEVEGGTDFTTSTLVAGNPVSFVEKALDEVIASVVANEYEPASATVATEGFTLSDTVQTQLVDKFTIDPAIASLTFA
ncbi:hypothetical protein F3157_05360 [Virgibacillus dakarensis]|uniref:hypothetical protein n=1 Tax=Virgibacillus dakarensis TaxID=1917889 RepID=UPI000B44E218|nr:hypothetical protein [Virgibacillus dakarensis]MTW85085.1 hypothetical protein [Virgibacillus dakarensis]